MKKLFTLRPLLAFALVLLAGACATTSGRGGEAGSSEAVQVEVENTVTPALDLTVYLVSEAGTRRLLGSVPPGRTVTLTFNGFAGSGLYRLLARPTGGREVLSNTFSFTGPGSTIRWNLISNIASTVN